MAVVNLDDNKGVVSLNTPKVVTLTASHTDGMTYTVAAADEKTCVIVYNSSANTAYDITIKSPTNAVVGGKYPDKVVEVGYGKIAVIEVETAKYMDASTKKITLDSENAALLAAVIEFKN